LRIRQTKFFGDFDPDQASSVLDKNENMWILGGGTKDPRGFDSTEFYQYRPGKGSLITTSRTSTFHGCTDLAFYSRNGGSPPGPLPNNFKRNWQTTKLHKSRPKSVRNLVKSD
jgi:hypothetical protein